MIYIPELHHRRTIRLRDYDYRQNGAYFVTICSWNKECLFGEIIDGKMHLNENGMIVEKEWLQTPIVRSYAELDEFVIMPNHFHGIIVLIDNVVATRWVAQKRTARPFAQKRAIHRIAPTEWIVGAPSGSIGAIIGQFKSIVTKYINQIHNTPRVPVWQRSFHDRIIRNENELNEIREYILNNPLKWELDNENPKNITR